jgi:hypothetical protein
LGLGLVCGAGVVEVGSIIVAVLIAVGVVGGVWIAGEEGVALGFIAISGTAGVIQFLRASGSAARPLAVGLSGGKEGLSL